MTDETKKKPVDDAELENMSGGRIFEPVEPTIVPLPGPRPTDPDPGPVIEEEIPQEGDF